MRLFLRDFLLNFQPSHRNRVAERSSAISRVARPTLGSPVIFSSNGSPLKEFLDSPLTRQTAKHNKQLEDCPKIQFSQKVPKFYWCQMNGRKQV